MTNSLHHRRNTLLHIDPKLFWHPPLKDFPGVNAPTYCFLISHGTAQIVFDLGVRTDWENLPPRIVSLRKATTTITSGSSVASVLDSHNRSNLNIRSADISSVIWSHNHFDHTGDPSTFPASTELVVGPGVRDLSWPGWPSDQEAGVLDSDIIGRKVREINFSADNPLKIGSFDAFDFFGDGSFYLLDAPGHAQGHICGLARTTASPNSFVFMGADACHHPGVLRPTEFLPLPRSITPTPLSFSMNTADKTRSECPGSMLQTLSPGRSPTTPFFQVARSPLFSDHDAAIETVRKIQELDASAEILVVLAHDLSLRERLPLFPETVNDWMKLGLKEATRWSFCGDFERALQATGEDFSVG